MIFILAQTLTQLTQRETIEMDILPQLILNSLIAGSIYALASSGLSLTYGLLKILNFAHGHFMMLGAYLFYLFAYELGFSYLASTSWTLAITILFSILVLHIFILPFSKYSFILTIVTTLALANIIEACISMTFGVNVKSITAGYSLETREFYEMFITDVQIIMLLSAFLSLTSLAFVIHFTSLGRTIRAISENSYAAESLGINKERLSLIIFVLGAVLASYAGVLVGFDTNIQPTMGNSYTIKAFAVVILGGIGNFWGTIAGSFILGLVENISIGLDFGQFSLPTAYKDAFSFVIILLVLLIKPEGLFAPRRRAV